MTRVQVRWLVAIVAVGVIAGGAFYLGRASSPSPSAASLTTAPAGADARQVLYWHDPMVPGQRFDKPGKSPFMDMQLVPVYAGADGADGGVTISPTVQQNLGIRTAIVTRSQMAFVELHRTHGIER